MRKHIVLAIMIFHSLLFAPSEAYAATSVVMIEESVTGSQNANLRRAIKYVDRYTKSRFKIGKCTYDKRCIMVKTSGKRAKATGWSQWKGSARKNVTITVNPGRGNDYMARLYAHEIGHAMFLPHSTSSTNLMYARLIKKNGKLVPFNFTSGQRKTLGRH